jgi:hypothetical protein
MTFRPQSATWSLVVFVCSSGQGHCLDNHLQIYSHRDDWLGQSEGRLAFCSQQNSRHHWHHPRHVHHRPRQSSQNSPLGQSRPIHLHVDTDTSKLPSTPHINHQLFTSRAQWSSNPNPPRNPPPNTAPSPSPSSSPPSSTPPPSSSSTSPTPPTSSPTEVRSQSLAFGISG